MRYAVVIEQGERNFSAYVPDLPGCVAVGGTLEEVKAEIREAIEFHLEGMREDGGPSSRSRRVRPSMWRLGNRPRKEMAPSRRVRQGAQEGLCRRSLPRMRQLHHGQERHVPEVRHLRVDDGVLVSKG